MTTISYYRTFHTRLRAEMIPALDAWADLFGRAERQVHVRLSRGDDVKTIARTGYAALGLNAKQFEHAMISVRGKRDAVAELAKLRVGELKSRIKSKEKAIKRRQTQVAAATQAIASATRLVTVLEGKIRAGSPDPHVPMLHEKGLADLESARERRTKARRGLHQHRRRLTTLKQRLSKAETEAKNPSLCFGSKRLFKAQHRLEENRLGSHADWREEWRDVRANHVLVVGDAVYSSGNAFAKLRESDDGGFALELRLPPGLAHLADRTIRMGGSDQHVLTISGLSFAHDVEVVRQALADKRPMTWRFVRDEISWTAHVTVEDRREVTIKDFGRGCLGVDVNVDHLAVTHVSPDGNPLRTWSIPCVTYGANANRAGNIVRHAVLQAVQLAKALGVPIACERLDFAAKKSALEDERSPRRARMLSSFAYGAILGGLRSCAFRHGVAVRAVNPAYTSLIGRMKFARRYGLSVHAAAALAIGRRAMHLSERPPCVEHLDGAVHGTPRRPEDRRGHVWRVWARLARETAAHAARGRAGRKAGSGSVEARARTRPTGFVPSSAGRPPADRATTGPTAWPVTVGAIPAVHRNRGSTAESG